ncbi:MAG: hypothetical protein WCJ56_14170 [bacterium]
MALTIQQKRKRDMTIVALTIILVVVATMGKATWSYIFKPSFPGYADAVPAGNYTPLDWGQLALGDWPMNGKPLIPDPVKPLEGKQVVAKGFILPLHTTGEASEFFLAEKQVGCYFCNRPKISEVIKVKIAGGKNISPVDFPTRVFGTLHLAPDDGTLYVIDDAVLMVK